MAMSNKPRVSTRICRFLPLIFLPASNLCGSIETPPFFCALHALTVDDRGGGAGLAPLLRAAEFVKRIMHTPQPPAPAPGVEVAAHRALRGKILGKIAPLATGAQQIHDGVEGLPHVGLASASTALCGRNKRFNQRPFRVRDIAGVAQFIAIVPRAVFTRPHRRPSTNQLTSLES